MLDNDVEIMNKKRRISKKKVEQRMNESKVNWEVWFTCTKIDFPICFIHFSLFNTLIFYKHKKSV